MAEVVFGNDGDFSHEKMIQKVNTNLANELGNLCQRTLSMVVKNCDGAVPSVIGPYTSQDEELLSKISSLRSEASVAISIQAIQKYVEVMVSAVWEANKYIDFMAPWALKKTDPARMTTVLYVVMEVLRKVAILYQPLIPTAANKILDQLGVPMNERTFDHLENDFSIRLGTPIPKPEGIFPRIEIAKEEIVFK